jgi:hypothetical protein
MSEWLKVDGKVERETLIEGIVLTKICKHCRPLMRTSWGRKTTVPKSRRLWRQASPGGVFHMYDRKLERQACK